MLGIFLLVSGLLMLCGLPGFAYVTKLGSGWTLFFDAIKIGQGNNVLAGGGIIGITALILMIKYTGIIGSVMISLFLVLVGLALFLSKTLYEMIYPPIAATKIQLDAAKKNITASIAEKKARKIFDGERLFEENEVEDDGQEELFFEEEEFSAIEQTEQFTEVDEPILVAREENISDLQVLPVVDEAVTAVLSSKAYRLPPLTFLTNFAKTDTKQDTNRTQQKRVLQETLTSFGVKATVSAVRVGPAVTQYEVTLAPGVKVNRIVNLSTDISLAMAAKGVRIEAPIPGKSAVGIEIPNAKVQMVGLYEVLRKTHQDKREKLLVGLGRTISGDAVNVELNKMPHLLVAGSTGSGKSVCINTIITSILLRAKPEEVKFLMIDPKKVELNGYNDIPHLLAPVVTEPKRAAVALKKVVDIMEQRYEIFANSGVRNLDGYNEYARENNVVELPYIVVIIDELADLMVVAAKEVEESIMRLAQMARAAGIHMIVATQRPSVDVITGVIKSNIPSRIAFAVSSQIDSRTILDMGGAERLVGKGDMLYLPAGEAKPIRVQGAYVSEAEIEKIVSFVKEQKPTEYNEEIIIATSVDVADELFDDSQTDALFEEAIHFAISIEMISTSKLQRRFRIGFNRASRIMDEMVEKGVLGPSAGNKGRPVLIKDISEIIKPEL
ncbi:MAG: DNA translocase FtsK [Culicoidibacterales bacterium]